MLETIENDTLPNALMIGVDYDLFWTLNPKSLAPFVKAFKLKQQYDDMVSWQSGSYIKMAITASFNKSFKYPNKPLLGPKDAPVATNEVIKEKFLRQMNLINRGFGKE